MGLVEEAFKRLYPGREFRFGSVLRYSGRFSNYNANARLRGDQFEFGLSRAWRGVSDEIKIGLVQELLVNLLKDRKKNTINIDLYNEFIKNIHLSVEKNMSDPMLVESFERVNSDYFDGLIERPNLVFGNNRKRTLAHYNYQTDTINFSPVMLRDKEALDYVMYHELLHKKLKFRHESGRSYHHTGEFRRREKIFNNCQEIERRLKRLVSAR